MNGLSPFLITKHSHQVSHQRRQVWQHQASSRFSIYLWWLWLFVVYQHSACFMTPFCLARSTRKVIIWICFFVYLYGKCVYRRSQVIFLLSKQIPWKDQGQQWIDPTKRYFFFCAIISLQKLRGNLRYEVFWVNSTAVRAVKINPIQ